VGRNGTEAVDRSAEEEDHQPALSLDSGEGYSGRG
jgi:hypothetical protein